MNKNKGMIILSIILAVQFILPLSIWGYETYKQSELNEKGEEIKLLVDWVQYEDCYIDFENESLHSAMYSNENKYVVFELNEDGFAVPVVKSSPETDIYISVNKLKSWYNESWGFKYESDVTKSKNMSRICRLYNKENEAENIRKGKCEGPATQAYAVFKIYKNRFKVVNVYIDGTPVDTIVEKYNNNQYDVERYEYDVFETFEDYYHEEIVEYTDVNGEYVTEPVTA